MNSKWASTSPPKRTPVYIYTQYLLHESVYNMGRHFINIHKYFHKPKVSENTSVRVKCHYHTSNKLFIIYCTMVRSNYPIIPQFEVIIFHTHFLGDE